MTGEPRPSSSDQIIADATYSKLIIKMELQIYVVFLFGLFSFSCVIQSTFIVYSHTNTIACLILFSEAIVYIHLSGGVDSFNILVPHNNMGCYLYEDYYQARGGDTGIGLGVGTYNCFVCWLKIPP